MLSDRAARAWLESYADQIALRDARTLAAEPDAYRLQRYLEAYAVNSGRGGPAQDGLRQGR